MLAKKDKHGLLNHWHCVKVWLPCFGQQLNRNADRMNQNNDPNREEYNTFTNNCGTFMQETIEAGGVDTPTMIDPRPNSYIEELRDEYPHIDYKKDENK